MHPLMTPFKNTDFYWNMRLASILLPDQDGRIPVRLLNSQNLLKYIVTGGKMKSRQELEREQPDIFCTLDQTKQLLKDIDKRPTRKDLVFFPGIVALTYAWVQADHPDPDGKQLLELAPILEWLLSERALLMMRSRGEFNNFCQLEEADAPSVCYNGVFIDFMCINQLHPDQCTTPQQVEEFEPIRHNVSVLYAHALTMQLKITDTPGGAGEHFYSSRGWCLVEDQLAGLVKRPEYRLNVSEWKHRNQRFGAVPSDEFGTDGGWEKTLEQLAGQGDCYAVGHAQTLNTLKDFEQRPPMSPPDLEAAVEGRLFGAPGDRASSCAMYRGCAVVLLGERTGMELQELEYQESDWRILGGVLSLCPKLSTLTLRRMNLSEAAARDLFGSMMERRVSLPQLKSLSLAHNTLLGGVDALAAAMAEGAFPTLQTLNLCNAKVDGTGFKALVGAMAAGHAQGLVELDMSSNPVGDMGMEAFKELASGVLPELTKLHLYGCNIGDEGCFALIQALSQGGMPKLAQAEDKDKAGHIDIFRRRNSMSDRVHSNTRKSSSGSALARRNSPYGMRPASPTRQSSIGMMVGQSAGLTVEAKDALNAVLADRTKGPALLKRFAARREDEENALREMMLKEAGLAPADSAGGKGASVATAGGSACCTIS